MSEQNVEIRARLGHILTLRESKLVSFTEFEDAADAFQAAGLRK
jgi:hypothetical protein